MIKSNRLLFLCFILIFTINACNTRKVLSEESVKLLPTSDSELPLKSGDTLQENSCIAPRYPFAYLTRTNGNVSDSNYPRVTLPEPWKPEADLPQLPDSAVIGRSKDWLLAAFSKSRESHEIWVLRSWTDESSSGSDYKFMEILIYSPQTKAWRSVPIQVKDLQAIVGELFMTNDGSIWAQNYSGDFVSAFEPPLRIGISRFQQELPAVPLLSKYNEEEARFEAENGIRSLPSSKLDNERDRVVLDNSGVFWVFVQGDGIYSYKPVTQTINRHVDLPSNDIPIRSVALAQDGSIFFSDDFASVFRFLPKTEEVIQLGGTPLPFENAYNLHFHNILIDHSGRLWLGDVGWAEPDSYTTWYQLVPSPVFITDQVEDLPIHQWERPWLILESLDGLLWYKSSNGMVWLDLQKEKWCWFTTEQSNIVEDQKRNLWMIGDGKLYKYSLNP